MNRRINVAEAREIMGDNFIGPKELLKAGISHADNDVPAISFSEKDLMQRRKNYILILGLSTLDNGFPVTIRNLKKIYGKDPDVSEPCFYNQDWYENETFMDIQLEGEWYLIRKEVYGDSRGIQPDELMERFVFPSAIRCVYAFFMAWNTLGVKLWYHDFVWCSDVDHNGDRIYVGKYNDVDGVNKNGFSIHRHLSLRECYACID